jgi:acyl-CoA synthetase (AMP-forming)/AMP-acid ligase II
MLRRCAEEFPMRGLVQVYGQTETATLVSCPWWNADGRIETAGPLLPGFDLRIIDPETGAQAPDDRIGEIEVRGPMVMTGYHDRPEDTEEAIHDGGWLRTGDLGCLDHQGRLVIAGGRLKDMIIRGGENVYPAEIEIILARHPAVVAAAVFGAPDRYYGEIVVAAVRLRAEAGAAELAGFCAERIADFKVPARFYRVAEFPLAAIGKLRHVVLRRMAEAGELEALP